MCANIGVTSDKPPMLRAQSRHTMPRHTAQVHKRHAPPTGDSARWRNAQSPTRPSIDHILVHFPTSEQGDLNRGARVRGRATSGQEDLDFFIFRLVSPTFWLNTADFLWIPKGGSWVGGWEGGRGEGSDCMPRCELFNGWSAFWIPFGALETENEWFATCNVSKNSGFGLNTFDVQIKLFEVGLLLCAFHEK